MKTISQFIEILNTINKHSYFLSLFKTPLEPLLLLDEISPEIEDIFSDQQLLFSLDQANMAMQELFEFLQPHLKTVEALTKKKSSKDRMKPYADFRVDDKPIIVTEDDVQVQLQFDELSQIAKDNGKPLKPVNRKKAIAFKGCCPHCGAPNEYLYDNTGKGKQFLCKACSNTFGLKLTVSSDVGFYCPHCKHKLDLKHERSKYDVFICPNYRCSFYLVNKQAVKDNSAEHLETSSHRYNLHYHYRQFDFNLSDLQSDKTEMQTKVDLSKIHCDEQALGLIMTYYINYGLSARKTALIMYEVHGLKISHQTVMNYADAVSKAVQPIVDNYDYELSDTLVGDETYVKTRGKNDYVFFFSDPEGKAITSYNIFANRSTEEACKSIMQSLSKFKKLPENLKLITDGNPIYNAAQLFFSMQDIHFELIQVIGVKNKDETSKKYRSFKQIEERLNRTFKHNYHGMNGFDNLDSANSYMVNYVAFFNFLRQHSSLGYKTPVQLDELTDIPFMQDKWLALLKLSKSYHSA